MTSNRCHLPMPPRRKKKGMTAAEWTSSTHVLEMLDALEGGSHELALRRFASACCRR